ncbi:MAG: alpha/beta hydrolase [Oscillospiraceae bacterium]|nr:alpha/beta hydrolase [Oscillospiraceae bacterium]
MKKALKIIRNILLVILSLLILFVLVCFIMQNISRSNDRQKLTDHGLCNLVSAGNIKLNVPVFGSSTPDHTIVALPGSGDSTFAPAMQSFAEYVESNCKFAVIERPGYGLSDVGRSDMTAEYVVECSRTALQNAGIEAPYVLMPHSLGGIYATYWVNTYPDEIEGVLFLDSVFDPDAQMSLPPNFYDHLFNVLVSTGIFRMLEGAEISNLLVDMLPEAYQSDAVMMLNYRPYNKSISSELALIDDNLQTAWDSIRPTDCPKIYIYTDAAYIAKRQEYIEKLGNCEAMHIPASHFIYLHKPEETAGQLERLLDMI